MLGAPFRVAISLAINLVTLSFWLVHRAIYGLGRIARRRERRFVRVTLPARWALSTPGAVWRLLAKRASTLRWLERWQALIADETVHGVVVTLPLAGWGWAQAEQVGTMLELARARGKTVVATSHAFTAETYFAALHADVITVTPAATLHLNDPHADLLFFGGPLERLGVETQFVHIGRYKTAGHRFSRRGSTRAQRDNLRELLEGLHRPMLALAERRGRLAIARPPRGPIAPGSALGLGLVDLVAHHDELAARLERHQALTRAGASGSVGSVGTQASSAAGAWTIVAEEHHPSAPVWRPRPLVRARRTVAVVEMSGLIMMGDEGPSLNPKRRVTTVKEHAKLLRALAKRKDVRAVVLAIDSPGGSATASELLWREVSQLRAVKPVVACLRGVAASGGYYVAAACSTIVAQRTTMTGSIGVVGGRFSVGRAMARLAVGHENIHLGDGGVGSPFRPLDAEDTRQLRRMLRATYRRFVDRVARGRGLERAEVHALGQGRVYTGDAARACGLVDELGDLEVAIERAAGLAGIARQRVELEVLPRARGGLRGLLRGSALALSGSAAIGRQATAAHQMTLAVAGLLGDQRLPEVAQQWHAMQALFVREGVVTWWPEGGALVSGGL